jgi:hypothetical protein
MGAQTKLHNHLILSLFFHHPYPIDFIIHNKLYLLSSFRDGGRASLKPQHRINLDHGVGDILNGCQKSASSDVLPLQGSPVSELCGPSPSTASDQNPFGSY